MQKVNHSGDCLGTINISRGSLKHSKSLVFVFRSMLLHYKLGHIVKKKIRYGYHQKKRICFTLYKLPLTHQVAFIQFGSCFGDRLIYWAFEETPGPLETTTLCCISFSPHLMCRSKVEHPKHPVTTLEKAEGHFVGYLSTSAQ